MREPTAKVCNYADVEAKVFGDASSDVAVRQLIDEEHDGASIYNFRIIEVASGNSAPDHVRPFEHRDFILDGEGKVKIGDEWYELGPDYVVFVLPGVQHTYLNT